MRAIRRNEQIYIYDAYLFRESIREINGWSYDADEKAWVVPLSTANCRLLELLGASFDEPLKAINDDREKPDLRAISSHPKPPVKATLYRHQQAAYDFGLDIFTHGNGLAILAAMGTGKSLMTIAIIGTLHLKGQAARLLVVCPKSIVGVWEDEFRKFADFRYALTVLDGTLIKKKEAFEYMQGKAALQVIVVNYESCWRLEREIVKWKPDAIVCDESSKIKNPGTAQSKAMHRLGKLARYKVILTGTPVTNNPLDFYSQYKFLDESIFGTSYYAFRGRYAVMGGFQNHQIVGYRHLAELVEKVHSIAFRIKIEDAVDLPPFIDETRLVQLEPKAESIYHMIEKDCYAELANGEVTARNILTQLLRLSQCTGGFIRSDDSAEVQAISRAKLDALDDIIDSCVEAGRKLVVFARFVPEIDAIRKLLEKKGIGHSLIMGATKDRAGEVKRFQEDPETKVFVGQLQTTGMGLTLTAANVAVFYSLDFSYANYEQSRARIHRIGQAAKCLYIHLVCKGTVDEKILHTLEHKGNVATLMVDNWRELLCEDK